MNDINKLISDYTKHSQDKTLLLCITIKPVAYDDTSLIPKLEYVES